MMLTDYLHLLTVLAKDSDLWKIEKKLKESEDKAEKVEKEAEEKIRGGTSCLYKNSKPLN